jgi:hypothetical protein
MPMRGQLHTNFPAVRNEATPLSFEPDRFRDTENFAYWFNLSIQDYNRFIFRCHNADKHFQGCSIFEECGHAVI